MRSARHFTALAIAASSLLAALQQPARGQAASARPAEAVGGNAPHGALEMDRQLARLTPLLAGVSPTAIPAGIAEPVWTLLVPADNRGSDARVALGRRLYFDPRLSRDGTVACATCHDVSRGFTDRRPLSEGIGDQIGHRNAPTTMNSLFFQTQFWDGRATTLEDQAKLPIVNPIEMGQPDGEAAAAAIASDASYQKQFQDAYERPVNYDDISRAIAAFERTLVFVDAPFDRFLAGDTKAIDDDAKAGWALFNGKGRCAGCHQVNGSNPIFTDNDFHNIGVAARHQNFEELARRGLEALGRNASKEAIDQLALQTDLSELGRFVVTRNRSDIGAFKTEQLRNIGLTAPYMHDGSMATLWDVIDHYNKGGEANPFLDGGIEPLDLTDHEIDQLVAFLFTLTDDHFAHENEAEMARQRGIAAHSRPLRDEALATRKELVFEKRATGRK